MPDCIRLLLVRPGCNRFVQLESVNIPKTSHLRDIVSRPRQVAKAQLYTLFKRLGSDFNGDLFSDDLDEESQSILSRHLEILEMFLCGTDVITGQRAFWPYDFSMIPIETISAIYEHFLQAEDPEQKRRSGAFYTPRFLADVTLDIALDGTDTLLGKRFLDPACGSGIFLVGLFSRLAEDAYRASDASLEKCSSRRVHTRNLHRQGGKNK